MRRRITLLLPFCFLCLSPSLRAHSQGEPGSRLLFAALHRPMVCQPPPPSPEEKEKARVRLGITSDQQAQIESLFKQTGQERRAAFAKTHDLYRQLHTLYDAYDFDQRKARSIRNEILALNRRILALHAETEVKLRRILNRDQFERMRDLMKQHEGERRGRRHDDDRGGKRPPPDQAEP